MDFTILVPLTFFWTIISWKFYNDRHKERMSLITQGLVPGELDKLSLPFTSNDNKTLTNLKWGIVALFMGIAGMVTWWINQTFEVENMDTFGVCLMLIAGGLSLILFHLMNLKVTLKNIEKEKLEVIKSSLDLKD